MLNREQNYINPVKVAYNQLLIKTFVSVVDVCMCVCVCVCVRERERERERESE